MSSGTVITGTTVSVMTHVKLTVVVPNEFDAEQVTVVDPIGKNEPDVCEQLTPAPGSSHVAVPPSELVASPTTISGMLNCGGAPPVVRSTTLKVTGPITRVPVVSVARTVTEYWPD